MAPFESLRSWPVENLAVAVVGPGDRTQLVGDIDRVFALASLTKLLTAMAVLVAHEEGTIGLDEPVDHSGATIADLLAHSAGIAPDRPTRMADPQSRRIYSTAGYDMAAELLEKSADMPFGDYLREAVLRPLGMDTTTLVGSAGAGARSSVRDLLPLLDAWHNPVLIHDSTLRRATTAHCPELDGILPGYGQHRPNPWGLGPEIRGHKSPHWTAPDNAPATYGHFGRTGTMTWIDPVAAVAVIALCDRPFGPWAVDAWPRFSAEVLTD